MAYRGLYFERVDFRAAETWGRRVMEDMNRWVNRAIRCQLDRSNLTAERERELLIICQTSDCDDSRQAALIELWESHSKLVVAIASRHRRPGIELLDLVGAGHLGLHTAISRFDTRRTENRLSSFAAAWISWTIKDYIRRNCAVMRLPESNAHRQLAQMKERLVIDARRSCERDQVEPTDAAICQRIGYRIGMDPSEVAQCLRLLNGGILSLHAAPPDGADTVSLEDTLPDDSAVSEDDVILRLDREKARRRVRELAQDVLGERERAVFIARCLAEGDDVVKLDVLADRFGVTRERIHQLETSAKRKIATALAREGFDQFVTGSDALPIPSANLVRRTTAPRRHRPTVRLTA